jgi:hypothetical protein
VGVQAGACSTAISIGPMCRSATASGFPGDALRHQLLIAVQLAPLNVESNRGLGYAGKWVMTE